MGAGDCLLAAAILRLSAEVFGCARRTVGAETNLEQIISLEPQCCLWSTMARPRYQVAQLEAAGIRVVVSDAQNIEGVYDAVYHDRRADGTCTAGRRRDRGHEDDVCRLAARAGELEGKSVLL